MGSDPAPAWRRLHALSPLVNLGPQAWKVLKGWWPLLLALAVGSQPGFTWLDALFLGFFLLFPAIRSVVHWAVLRWRIREDHLEIRTGLFVRQVRVIGPDRIQNAEIVRNPIHRLSGVAEVRLDTAGGLAGDGLLSALALPVAEGLLTDLEALRRTATAPNEGPVGTEPVLLAQSLPEVLGHGLSSFRGGTLAIGVGVGLEVVQQVPAARDLLLAQGLPPRLLVALLLGSWALGMALSAGASLLRWYRLAVTTSPDRLVVEHGLFTRRRVVLPRRRLQVLLVEEPLLRRLMGYATIHVETAGLAVGPDGLRQAEATLPMVDRDRLPDLCREVLPGADLDPWSGSLSRPPVAALAWQITWVLGASGILVAFAALLMGPWGFLAAGLWPIAVVGALLDWAWQGWAASDRVLVARRGFWTRRSFVLPRARVQAVHGLQGPLLRALGLARVVVHAAGSRVVLPPLSAATARILLEGAAPRGAGIASLRAPGR
ncbi:MAG: PH domain-containing protein [Deltaproteobacteria bacterium]|nr:PH domain-containing protein [Deltaproteobacteria bacterium]